MTASPFTLDRTARRTLRAETNGAEYRIATAWPAESPPPAGFPVVVLLDADATFATLVESLRRAERRTEATNIAPAIVVGVGFPEALPYDDARRTFDYSFGPAASGAGADGTLRTGGGPAFLDFLDRELIPRVAADLPIAPHRRALFGHSLGGLFVLHAFLERPTAFRTWLSVSPSIWWDKPALLRRIDQLPQALAACRTPPDLMITVGEYEEAVAPWQKDPKEQGSEARLTRRLARAMVGNTREIADRLAAAAGPAARVGSEVLAQEDHASALTVSFGRGLRLATGSVPPRHS